MFVKLWLESWRQFKSRTARSAQGTNGEIPEELPLHEWLIPFPGFFHAEKQALYAICKEMLDGLSLEELAKCAGLSSSIVDKILKLSHARNNRAVLFNLACAMIIHLIEVILLDEGSLDANLPICTKNGLGNMSLLTKHGVLSHPLKFSNIKVNHRVLCTEQQLI